MKKNILIFLFIVTIAPLISSCSNKTPADVVVKPDTEILQKQKDFDQAMIEKANAKK